MKKYFFWVSIFLVTPAFAIQLHQATNAQLLEELGRRLLVGNTNPGAQANYLCDSNYLKVSVIGDKHGEASLYLNNIARCTEQADVLNRHKSKISSLTIIALCDSNYLRRYKIVPSGELSEVDSLYLNDYAKCFAQAKLINQN